MWWFHPETCLQNSMGDPDSEKGIHWLGVEDRDLLAQTVNMYSYQHSLSGVTGLENSNFSDLPSIIFLLSSWSWVRKSLLPLLMCSLTKARYWQLIGFLSCPNHHMTLFFFAFRGGGRSLFTEHHIGTIWTCQILIIVLLLCVLLRYNL